MGTNGNDNPLVLAYLTPRRVVGALGVLLPPILFFGALILSSTRLQESISHYYGTVMRASSWVFCSLSECSSTHT